MLVIQTLEQDLISVMPRARRYSRALIGNTHDADLLLAEAAASVIKNKPFFYFLTPTKIVLPWLFVELHKTLDSNNVTNVKPPRPQYNRYETTLNEQLDSGLMTLSEIQKRSFLLTHLEQYKFSATASILGISVDQATAHFKQAHRLVSDHINENFASFY